MENHRSLRDEQRLTLTAASRNGEGTAHVHALRGVSEPIVPAVALYGANASGKTNVLHALRFMREAVLLSHRFWEPKWPTPQEPFALDKNANAPSRFEVDVWVDGTRYRYGFVLSKRRVEEEWLYAWPGSRRQMWFSRTADRYDIGRSLGGETETIKRLTRENALFLSAAAQHGHRRVMPLFGWFQRLRMVMRRDRSAEHLGGSVKRLFELPSSPARQLSLLGEADAQVMLFDHVREQTPSAEIAPEREALLRLLRAADTGIEDVKVDTDDARSRGQRPFLAPRRSGLLFKHRSAGGKGAWLPLEVQSAGTVTLLEVGLRLIQCLREGGVLCVDELEASLHPMLALELLRMFQSGKDNKAHAQILFTTHDTNLLGNVLGDAPLRRDQIWFTEKDDKGATHLYPLTDFHPRKEENLERGYLQGRYGAVPFLGDLSRSAVAKKAR